MSFLITAAAIGVGSSLYGIGKGISQNAQANKIDKNNPRPIYQIPKEYLDNVTMARQMAQVGLPQQQYNNQLNLINRNSAVGIGAISRSANPGAGVAQVVRASNDATNTLTAQDAAARQDNQRFLIGQNGVLGQQRLAKQQYDKFDKYSENFNRAQGLRGAANANIQNGVGGIASMAGGIAAANMGGNGVPAQAPQAQWGGMGGYQYNGGSMAPNPFNNYGPSYTPAWGYTPPFSFGSLPKMPKNLY